MLSAQPTIDSVGIPLADSSQPVRVDSSVKKLTQPSATGVDSVQARVTPNGFLSRQLGDSLRVLPTGAGVAREADRQAGEQHQARGKEGLFYALLGMVFGLALFRRFYPKYWNDLFRLFFRTTLRQRQLRDQLELASLPSLVLNAFFFLSLSFYLSLFFTQRGWNPVSGYWLFWLLVLAGLMGMYLVKWLGLHFASWVFGQRDLGDDYAFLVFTVNKMMGLLLLPSVIVLAFGEGRIWEWSLGLSWFLIGGILLYRGYLTYRVVRRQAVVSPFHFFLYWIGFELAPLLVLYRFLQGFFSEMT